MTKAELKKNWEKVLELLAESINRNRVDAFFRPLSPSRIREKDSVIMMNCGNSAFFQSSVDRYASDVEKATEAVFGKPYSLLVTDKESDENELDIDQFDPRYTFDTFVAGDNNRLAYAMSMTVAERFDIKHNPLFIYGGSGLGKTHLIQAIGQYVIKENPRKKVIYVSSETFTNEYISSISSRTVDDFRNKYRSADLLLIDDIQFIVGKQETVTEFFNTFNALYNAKKQIVLTSDKLPKDLGDLPERLVSRFAGGMIADIGIPEYETRLAILKRKASVEDVDTDDPDVAAALDLIAQGIQTNIRELESAFTRVLTFSNLEGKKITRDYAKSILTDIYNIKAAEITPQRIKEVVADHFGITPEDIESSKRSREIAYPRQIAIYLSKEKTNYSLEKIASFFGNRNHTTIMYSHKKVREDMERDRDLREVVEKIEEML